MKALLAKSNILFQRSEFLSPLYLIQWAVFIGFVFLLVELAGLREFTSILNGTVGSVARGWDFSIILAVIYIVTYLAFVVLVPILLLAAGILKIGQYMKAQKNK
jgi:hypothetical protein